MEYVALLLGINVGTRTVKMAELKAVLEGAGYTKVRTVLASGNVIFEAGRSTPGSIIKKLEPVLEDHFGFKIELIVRSLKDIASVIKGNPFKKIPVTKNTRLYVTFLSQKPPRPEKPRVVSEQYQVLNVTDTEVFSHLELSERVKTPDIMKELGATYGKKITTRNWNTLQKIIAAGAV